MNKVLNLKTTKTFFQQSDSAGGALRKAGVAQYGGSYDVHFIVGVTHEEGQNIMHFCSSMFALDHHVAESGLFPALRTFHKPKVNTEEYTIHIPDTPILYGEQGIWRCRSTVLWEDQIHLSNLVVKSFIPVDKEYIEDLKHEGGLDQIARHGIGDTLEQLFVGYGIDLQKHPNEDLAKELSTVHVEEPQLEPVH